MANIALIKFAIKQLLKNDKPTVNTDNPDDLVHWVSSPADQKPFTMHEAVTLTEQLREDFFKLESQNDVMRELLKAIIKE